MPALEPSYGWFPGSDVGANFGASFGTVEP
jgi:hypothetical protein